MMVVMKTFCLHESDTNTREEAKGTWLRQPVPVSLVKVIDYLTNKISFPQMMDMDIHLGWGQGNMAASASPGLGGRGH